MLAVEDPIRMSLDERLAETSCDAHTGADGDSTMLYERRITSIDKPKRTREAVRKPDKATSGSSTNANPRCATLLPD